MYLLEGLWGQERTKALEGSNYPQSAGAKLGSLFTSQWPQIHLNPGAQTMSSEVYVSSLCLDFSCSSAGKESACNAGDLGLTPGLGRSPGEGKGYPLQYSGLENHRLYGSWGCKESDTTERLSLSLLERLDGRRSAFKKHYCCWPGSL